MYRKMYLILFNVITDVLELLEKGNIWEAKKRLVKAQRDAEEVYISWNGDENTSEEE